MSVSFFDKLQARVDAVDSLLCVGLDPHVSEAPTADDALRFCLNLIEATKDIVAAYKPNAAFFEYFGVEGLRVLHEVLAAIPPEVPIVLDFKRGDIGTTAEAYAHSAYSDLGVDCVTISGYMGIDSISPFTDDATKAAFVLCKTSNPGSNDIQTLAIDGKYGKRVFEVVAELASGAWNKHNNIGLVVGATDVDALHSVRKLSPNVWILAPGIGFQGGDLKASLEAGLSSSGSNMLIPVSRGISRSANPRETAIRFNSDINEIRRQKKVAAASPCAATVSVTLTKHQSKFINNALEVGALRFGSFVLKSGRVSPYFFNAGLFRSSKAIAALGRTYADTIVASKMEYDVLFGPAYKGIPLVTAAAFALSDKGIDVPVCYNRKEVKDHGEGGLLVGADISNKRVLIIDDVISAGTAIGEAVEMIRAAGGTPVGVVIGLDRQERGNGDSTKSAVQTVEESFGLKVFSVVNLELLVGYIQEVMSRGGVIHGLEGMTVAQVLEKVQEYEAQYGVQK